MVNASIGTVSLEVKDDRKNVIRTWLTKNGFSNSNKTVCNKTTYLDLSLISYQCFLCFHKHVIKNTESFLE